VSLAVLARLWPRGHHDQDRKPFQAAGEILDPAKRLLIEPMRVVDQQRQRRSTCEVNAQPVQPVNRGEARISSAVGETSGTESQQCAAQPRGAVEQPATLLIGRGAQRSLEQLDRSPERKSPLALRSGRAKDIQAGSVGALLDRSEKPGLADSRRTDDHDEARGTVRNPRDPRVHSGQVAVAL
jgi:hypothetical protein